MSHSDMQIDMDNEQYNVLRSGLNTEPGTTVDEFISFCGRHHKEKLFEMMSDFDNTRRGIKWILDR